MSIHTPTYTTHQRLLDRKRQRYHHQRKPRGRRVRCAWLGLLVLLLSLSSIWSRHSAPAYPHSHTKRPSSTDQHYVTACIQASFLHLPFEKVDKVHHLLVCSKHRYALLRFFLCFLFLFSSTFTTFLYLFSFFLLCRGFLLVLFRCDQELLEIDSMREGALPSATFFSLLLSCIRSHFIILVILVILIEAIREDGDVTFSIVTSKVENITCVRHSIEAKG
mmetsp:Transcript_26097/g.66257  ORF Transcript_26097/g.66257 Transcript_26097/m.66257 type:complete len:220 (+) Transcript_26097:2106-2765(+)